jgi:hypothetical protein
LLASAVIGIAEMLASASLPGKDASIRPEERALIEPPLTRILERLDVQSVEKASALLDPVIMLVGIGFWINRIAPRPEKKPKEQRQPEPTPAQEKSNISPIDQQAAMLARLR